MTGWRLAGDCLVPEEGTRGSARSLGQAYGRISFKCKCIAESFLPKVAAAAAAHATRRLFTELSWIADEEFVICGPDTADPDELRSIPG